MRQWLLILTLAVQPLLAVPASAAQAVGDKTPPCCQTVCHCPLCQCVVDQAPAEPPAAPYAPVRGGNERQAPATLASAPELTLPIPSDRPLTPTFDRSERSISTTNAHRFRATVAVWLT